MLIIIASDPRTSHRPAEAVRVAAGLAALGQQRISVCFCETAALILSQAPTGFVDGSVLREHLPLLAQEAQGIYAETGDPILEGTEQIPYQRIGLTELAALARDASGVLRF